MNWQLSMGPYFTLSRRCCTFHFETAVNFGDLRQSMKCSAASIHHAAVCGRHFVLFVRSQSATHLRIAFFGRNVEEGRHVTHRNWHKRASFIIIETFSVTDRPRYSNSIKTNIWPSLGLSVNINVDDFIQTTHRTLAAGQFELLILPGLSTCQIEMKLNFSVILTAANPDEILRHLGNSCGEKEEAYGIRYATRVCLVLLFSSRISHVLSPADRTVPPAHVRTSQKFQI